MPVVNIWSYEGTGGDASVQKESPDCLEPYTYTKMGECVGSLEVGLVSDKEPCLISRAYIRFDLTALPAGATVQKVRLSCEVLLAGGADHLLDIHAYNVKGQADPCDDPPETCFNRISTGNLYADDLTNMRTVGWFWVDLGAQACIDVQNAKSAVNRFSLGLHEEGDDSVDGDIRRCYSLLEITYTPPPVVGYQYSDGLVTVRVG